MPTFSSLYPPPPIPCLNFVPLDKDWWRIGKVVVVGVGGGGMGGGVSRVWFDTGFEDSICRQAS